MNFHFLLVQTNHRMKNRNVKTGLQEKNAVKCKINAGGLMYYEAVTVMISPIIPGNGSNLW
jgi:hypothetical protein